MRLTSVSGIVYNVDVKTKTVSSDWCDSFNYALLVGAYAGSPSAEFRDATGHVIFSTAEIESAEGVPADNVTGENGNVVFRTENSAYEVDQEQKLFRRLAGVNSPTNAQYPDGEWQSYDRIELRLNEPALIYYKPDSNWGKRTSIVRDIQGTLVGEPAREVIALTVFVPDAPAV